MEIIGFIKNVEVDGYDRILTIQTANRTIWCSHIQPNEYLEPGQPSMYFSIDTPANIRVRLVFAVKYKIVDKDASGITQDIVGSPHAIVIGPIAKKKASDVYLIAVSEFEQIEVEFESNTEIDIGEYIHVEGELRVEADLEV
jgi:hypothetical protein